jgi:4-hydroxybenzoate polyprenyltransferase
MAVINFLRLAARRFSSKERPSVSERLEVVEAMDAISTSMLLLLLLLLFLIILLRTGLVVVAVVVMVVVEMVVLS